MKVRVSWRYADRYLVGLQLLLLILSLLSVAFFFRFHVISSSRQFVEDFKSQNSFELANGEIHVLARTLSALSKNPELRCVIAERNKITFFEERKKNCEVGFFEVVNEIDQDSFGVKIVLIHTLSSSLLKGFSVLFFILCSIGFSILWAQRRTIFIRNEGEFKMARLSRQVAHDLRSPIAAIKAISRDIGGHSEEILKSTIDRLDELVRDLSMEDGKRSAYNPILQKLINVSIAEKETEFADKNVAIGVDWLDSLGYARLPGNPFTWRRVLSNLLNNAIEASDSPTIKIVVGKSQSNSKLIEIQIKDNGRGIPKQLISRLGKTVVSYGKPNGRGIGLSTALTFLESLGGEVKIESIEGRGTSVILLSPYEIERRAVLVEDDVGLAKVWKIAAKKVQIELVHFITPGEFRLNKENLDKDTYFYIDLNYANGESGDELGRNLSSSGFRNLFICSGRTGMSIENYPWARGILGKEPPWLS